MSLIQIQASANPTFEQTPATDYHLIDGKRRLLFIVKGSRLYALEGDHPTEEEAASLAGNPPAAEMMPEPPALSLNIAQSCNLACRYCYADEGRFGGPATLMAPETAIKAIRVHIRNAGRGPVSIGFIGGEPLLNRDVLHLATRYAAGEAARRGIAISFGLTTNGTLLREDDIQLLRSYPFAVNVSMDGAKDLHDSLRPTYSGQSSFDLALKRIAPLLANPGNAWVAARVTVTRRNMDIAEHIDVLGDAGFPEIGVAPMRTGPEEDLQIAGSDWPALLAAMKTASEREWARARQTGGRLRFSNLSTALRQLYRGASNALPCGAAASYVSISADGHYYTCHRTVGDKEFELGDLASGPSLVLRRAFVKDREVDRQEPCRSCWARYLCGGGCHAEVMRTGREGCDSIRGWLEFCISLYPEVLATRPDLLKTETPRLNPQ